MLNEDLVRMFVGGENFERGLNYYRQGAVRDTFRQGDILIAAVEGSQYKPYTVKVTLDGGGIGAMRCTCPFVAGSSICKHIAAVLIAYRRQPELFVVQADPVALLEELSGEQLKTLWKTLLSQKPELTDWLVKAVTSTTAMPPSASPRRTPVNIESYRRQIKAVLRGMDYSRPYEAIYGATDGLPEIEKQAVTFLEGNDPHNALAILTEIAEQVIPKYGDIEDETQLSEYLSGWANTMAEAILCADLSPTEKAVLQKKMESWQHDLSDYGSDESIQLAALALEQGLAAPDDETRHRSALNQEVTNETEENRDENKGDSNMTTPSYWSRNFANELTEIKLRIAERTRDVETYLALCLKENAHLHYGKKLVELGRIDEARDHAIRRIVSPNDILTLAQMMQTANAIEAAYAVGLRGLALAGDKYRLGKWFAIFAESLGHPDMALKAWRAAFDTMPELESYQHLKRLSGDGWAVLRPELMRRLEAHSSFNINMLVEVLIDDGEIQRAMTIWDNSTWHTHYLLDNIRNWRNRHIWGH